MADTISFPQDAVLYAANATITSAYLVQDGFAELTYSSSEQTLTRTLTGGAILGVADLLSGGTALATARAKTTLQAEPLDREAVRRLIEGDPKAAWTIISDLCTELRLIDEAVMRDRDPGEVRHKNALQRGAERLLYGRCSRLLPFLRFFRPLIERPAGAIVDAEAFALGAGPPEGISPSLVARFGRRYEAEDVIFFTGDVGRECYVLMEGEVAIVVAGARNETPLAVLKAGDFFGEMAVLDGRVRLAHAICRTPVHVLALDLQGLRQLLVDQPGFAHLLARLMSLRIAKTWRRLPAVRP